MFERDVDCRSLDFSVSVGKHIQMPRILTISLKALLIPLCLCFQLNVAYGASVQLFEVFPLGEAEQQGETQTSEGYFNIPLGPTKKDASGRIYIKDSRKVEAIVRSLTYRMADEVAADDWVNQISRYFQTGGYELLFSCKSFECGRSSYWANQIFHDASLYGPDKNQHLITARKLIKSDVGQHYVYVTFYLTEKGNRRIFVHWLTAKSNVADALGSFAAETSQLESTGGLLIKGLRFDASTNEVSGDLANLKKLVAHLRANKPSWRLALVGHDKSGQGSIDEQIKRSEQFALSVAKNLQSLDETVVLKEFGVGPLAPQSGVLAENGSDHWVELIVIP